MWPQPEAKLWPLNHNITIVDNVDAADCNLD